MVAALEHLLGAVERLDSALDAEFDKSLSNIGLSRARLRLLRVVCASTASMTVSQVAREMGVSRQGVQRLADDLVAQGLCSLENNPRHARAMLLGSTPDGLVALEAAEQRVAELFVALGRGLDPTWLQIASEIMGLLERRLAIRAGSHNR